jgi:hypothetical protein
MSGFALVLLLSGALARVGTTGSCTPEPYADAPVICFANGLRIDTRIVPLPATDARLEAGTCWLVHVTGPVRQEWLARLRSIGAEPVCYIAYQTLVCRLRQDASAADVKEPDFVDWLGPYPASAKLAPELAGRTGPLDLVLSVWPDVDLASVAAAIAASGSEVTDATGRSIRLRLDAARLPELASIDPVAWIQEHSPARSYNSDVQWVMQVGWRPERPDGLSGLKLWARGIRGRNMVVGLFDKGVTTGHEMFVDPVFPVTEPGVFLQHRKLVAYKLYRDAAFGDAGDYHGTAVAGTLCGDDSIAGNASKLDGIAPDCRLYFVDNAKAFGVYVFDADLTALLDSVRLSTGMDRPVRQVSGSFGSEESLSYYRLEESSLDAVCWEDKQFLVIWAAANRRGPAYNIGHPAAAKNALTIGACGNGTESNTVWFESSRGPCRDERIKPNLVAPGVGVATADGRGYHSYLEASGTSISAPAASGALMLLRQYFAEGWYPTGIPDSTHRITQLSSALMRALAIAAADSNVGEEYMPNNAAGWGRLNVSNVMHFPEDGNGLVFLDEPIGVSTGDDLSFQFELSGRAPIHVALAWTDTAAAPGAAIAIVNDLDLELTSPDGNRYHGNQFYNGWSRVNPPGWDERNVEEVCLVPHPLTGRWTVRVIGRNVYTALQPFAVAVRGGTKGMEPGIAEEKSPGTGTAPRTSFQLPLRPGWRLALFAVDGRQVFDGTIPASGRPPIPALLPGIYFYRLTSGSRQSTTGKLVVAR